MVNYYRAREKDQTAMTSDEFVQILGIMRMQNLMGDGYRWLRTAIANCGTVGDAVELCTDENFHTLAQAIHELMVA